MGQLKNKRVLVTGGNGYLGRHLVQQLEVLGASVFIVDMQAGRKKNSFVVDITAKEKLAEVVRKIQPEVIYHLAASLKRDRDFACHDVVMKINYEGTYNLLSALKDIPYEQLVFSSTSEVYGGNKAPFNEKQLPLPASPYSLSKVCAEQLISTWSELHQKNFTILRLFNFFGRDMPANFFIPQLINSLRNEDTFKMTKGKQARDFLHVEDVVQALILAGTKKQARKNIYNVSSAKSVTLLQLVKEVKKRLKSKCVIDAGALAYRENEIWNMVGSNLKIKKELGFKVKYDLPQAIDHVLLDTEEK
jgi:nucleoside-diphosphate-sugar epimerase